MKIGIAVTTTPNRSDVFQKWLEAYKSVCSYPLYIHNDTEYKGVGYSKNKCLAALADYDYQFLFDDDCMPAKIKWELEYIFSGLHHAAYTFDRQILHQQPNYIEYEKPCGCMLFFTKACVQKVGGWDKSFSGYGYEHVNVSDRIFNNGLTPARYLDVYSKWLFTMGDCPSSFTAQDRAQIPNNYALYQQKFYSKEFIEFK